MAAKPNTVPGYAGGNKTSGERFTTKVAGTPATNDPTTEEGQYPVGSWGPSIFGGPLPDGTGAPGTAGAQYSSGVDPTNQPGQTSDTFSGDPDSVIGGTGATGAPGTQGATTDLPGPDTISFTKPGSPYSGTYGLDTVNDSVSGPRDWTGANDQGYATGGPQLPGIKGNEPQAGGGRYQPGSGRVLRGGRDVRP